MKSKIFKEMDQLVSNDTIVLASSTSCIVPSLFVSDLTHREQCIVAHPVRFIIICTHMGSYIKNGHESSGDLGVDPPA